MTRREPDRHEVAGSLAAPGASQTRLSLYLVQEEGVAVIEPLYGASPRWGSPRIQGEAKQLVEVIPWATAPQYLLRDGDTVYKAGSLRRVTSLSIEQVLTAPRSPW